MVPEEKENEGSPPAAATSPPGQLVAAAGVAATVTAAGNAFANAAPLMSVPLGFVSVTVNVLVLPVGIDAGTKPLLTLGPLSTLMVNDWAGDVFELGGVSLPSSLKLTLKVAVPLVAASAA